MYSWSVTVEPTERIVTIDGLKDYLQMNDETYDDAYIGIILDTFQQLTEQHLNRALAKRTIEERFDTWNASPWINGTGREIPLRWNPLIEIVSLKYLDADGAEQTVSSANYYTIQFNGKSYLILNDEYSTPELKPVYGAVRLTYTAGYDPIYTVPKPIMQAALMQMKEGYDHRGQSPTFADLPSNRILEPFIIY